MFVQQFLDSPAHTLLYTDTDTIPPCAAPRTAAVHKMVDACGTFVAASPNFKQ